MSRPVSGFEPAVLELRGVSKRYRLYHKPLYRFLDMWANESGHGVIFAVERADSTWPDRFALQLTGGADPPLEVLSAARMREIGKPFSLMTVTW